MSRCLLVGVSPCRDVFLSGCPPCLGVFLSLHSVESGDRGACAKTSTNTPNCTSFLY